MHGRLPAPRRSPESEPPATPHHGGRRAGRPPARASAHRGRAAWLAGAIVVVLAAVAVVVVHVMQNTGSQSADRTTSGTTHSSSQSSRPPSPMPTLPNAFAGSWSGRVQEPGTQQLENVSISLQTGAIGGTVSYSGPADLTCNGQLTVTTANSGQVTLNQAFQGHSKCVNGPVTLTMTSTDRLRFASNGSSGTLRRV